MLSMLCENRGLFMRIDTKLPVTSVKTRIYDGLKTIFINLDPETFYNNIFFTKATAAITKNPLYYKKCDF